jgi:hypothetical protein
LLISESGSCRSSFRRENFVGTTDNEDIDGLSEAIVLTTQRRNEELLNEFWPT